MKKEFVIMQKNIAINLTQTNNFFKTFSSLDGTVVPEDFICVASGDAGKLQHFYEAAQSGATVLLAVSMFHFGIIGIGKLKDYLRGPASQYVKASKRHHVLN